MLAGLAGGSRPRAREEVRAVEGPAVSRETLAAQALGEADPVTGGLAPVINPSTNYEQQADGSYRQDRQYTRADNPMLRYANQLATATSIAIISRMATVVPPGSPIWVKKAPR